MDKLDLEKPWGALGQIALIASVIGIVYLFFRWAVVVPEWGWRLSLAATAAGTLLYFGLAVRSGSRRKEEEPRPRPVLRTVLTVILVAVLTLPIWVLLYAWVSGAKLP